MSTHDDMESVNNNIRLAISIQNKLKSQNRSVPGIYNTIRFGKRVEDSIKMATYLTDCYLGNDGTKKQHDSCRIKRS